MIQARPGYPRGDTPKRADVGAFARGLAELANLEVLDATMFGKYAPIAGNVLMRCTDCFARLRVFVAPERESLVAAASVAGPALSRVRVQG